VRSLQESTPKARTAMLPTTPPTKTNELTGLVNNAGSSTICEIANCQFENWMRCTAFCMESKVLLDETSDLYYRMILLRPLAHIVLIAR